MRKEATTLYIVAATSNALLCILFWGVWAGVANLLGWALALYITRTIK